MPRLLTMLHEQSSAAHSMLAAHQPVQSCRLEHCQQPPHRQADPLHRRRERSRLQPPHLWSLCRQRREQCKGQLSERGPQAQSLRHAQTWQSALQSSQQHRQRQHSRQRWQARRPRHAQQRALSSSRQHRQRRQRRRRQRSRQRWQAQSLTHAQTWRPATCSSQQHRQRRRRRRRLHSRQRCRNASQPSGPQRLPNLPRPGTILLSLLGLAVAVGSSRTLWGELSCAASCLCAAILDYCSRRALQLSCYLCLTVK